MYTHLLILCSGVCSPLSVRYSTTEMTIIYTHFALGLISNSTATHLVWFERYQWFRKYRIDKYLMMFSTITVTVSTAIQSFYKTLWTTMPHQTKFGCKRIRSS